jgi:hypothetical protein
MLALAGACGRAGFDPSATVDGGSGDAVADAASTAPDFGSGCIVGFAMNEATWIGAAVIDSCGGDNNGGALGAAATVDDPVRGRVGQFGGPSDCIQVADAPELDLGTAVTTSAWIFPTGLDGVTPRGVVAKRTDDQTDVAYTMFVWTDDHVVVDIDGENDEMPGDAVLENGRWQMITAVYDGTLPVAQRIRIYVDGVLDKVLPETSATIPANAAPLTVGCLPLQPPTIDQQSFAGRLDDVGLWKDAFTAAEVQAWFQATRR